MSNPIETPLAGLAAFGNTSQTALWSQAAQIVGIGLQLSGDSEVLYDNKEEADELEIPRLPPLVKKSTRQAAINFTEYQEMWDIAEMLNRRSPSSAIISVCDRADWRGVEHPLQRQALSWITSITNSGSEIAHQLLPPRHLSALRRLWYICSTQRDSEAAATFLQIGLRSPYLIIRSTSAAQISWVDKKTSAEVAASLAEGCYSRNATISQISFDTLCRFNPSHPLIRRTSSNWEKGQNGHRGRAKD